GMEFSVLNAIPMHGLQLLKGDTHHPNADTASPAMAGVRVRSKVGIRQRFFGGGQGETVRARSQLEQFAVAGQRVPLEAFDLSADAGGEAAGIEALDNAQTAATGSQTGPGGCRSVTDGCHHAETGDGHPPARHRFSSGTNSARAPPINRLAL